MKQKKIDWKEIASDWKKVTFLVMLVIFLPLALYLLAVRNFLYFFIVAAVFYVAIKIIKRKE